MPGVLRAVDKAPVFIVLMLVVGLAAACGGGSSAIEEAGPAPVAPATDERATSGTTPGPSEEPATTATGPEQPPVIEPTPPAPATEPAPPAPEPLPGLPRFTAGYEDWLELNEDPIPPREGGDAHLSTKNVYASQEASRSDGRLEYPVGTVIVKEGIRPDTDFIGLIATMRKVQGADPDHNDWVFVEWVRSSPDASFEEIGRDATCWGCHGDAAETDYVWVHTLGSAP